MLKTRLVVRALSLGWEEVTRPLPSDLVWVDTFATG